MKIPMNMGGADRIIRGLLGAALIVIGMNVFGLGTVGGVICLAAAAIMFLTAALAWCPLYAPIHLSTRRKGKAPGKTLAA